MLKGTSMVAYVIHMIGTRAMKVYTTENSTPICKMFEGNVLQIGVECSVVYTFIANL